MCQSVQRLSTQFCEDTLAYWFCEIQRAKSQNCEKKKRHARSQKDEDKIICCYMKYHRHGNIFFKTELWSIRGINHIWSSGQHSQEKHQHILNFLYFSKHSETFKMDITY